MKNIFNKWLIWIKTQESSEIGGGSSTPGRGGWEKQVRNRNLQEIHQNQFQNYKNLFKIHQRNSWHPSKKCPIDFHHFQGPWRTWDANSSWWRREGGDHSLNLLKKKSPSLRKLFEGNTSISLDCADGWKGFQAVGKIVLGSMNILKVP